MKAKGEDFQTCSTSQLFDELGVKYERDENGLLVLDSYGQPRDFTYSDLGVDENRLFKDIIEIKGPVSFKDSNATNLGNLERIGEVAYVSFADTNIENLGNLKTVLGPIIFSRSKIVDAGKLEYIAGDVVIRESALTRDMFKNVVVKE